MREIDFDGLGSGFVAKDNLFRPFRSPSPVTMINESSTLSMPGVVQERGGGGYSQHQIDLIKGEAEPDDMDEWNWLQDHCNDLLPKESPAPALEVKPEFVPPTNAAKYAEAMEKKEDKD